MNIKSNIPICSTAYHLLHFFVGFLLFQSHTCGLLQLLLHCSSHTNMMIASLPLNFWYTFGDCMQEINCPEVSFCTIEKISISFKNNFSNSTTIFHCSPFFSFPFPLPFVLKAATQLFRRLTRYFVTKVYVPAKLSRMGHRRCMHFFFFPPIFFPNVLFASSTK